MNEVIFVFGSNLAGRHGKGAALYAKKYHGAIYGQGEGLQGSSYGIPTKDEKLRILSLNKIEEHVNKFINFANDHSDLTFEVTPIGCGLAGYKPEQIKFFFALAPKNVILPPEFYMTPGQKLYYVLKRSEASVAHTLGISEVNYINTTDEQDE